MDDRFPQRKSPRMKAFDYRSPNCYFVTICTKGKACLFDNPAWLSSYGRIARECMEAIPAHCPGVTVDQLVVMPNHVHAIIILHSSSLSLSTVVGSYKSAASRKIRATSPALTVWQASFHDHVIRNGEDYERIWNYIYTNPARWLDDCFYTPEADSEF